MLVLLTLLQRQEFAACHIGIDVIGIATILLKFPRNQRHRLVVFAISVVNGRLLYGKYIVIGICGSRQSSIFVKLLMLSQMSG